MYEYIVEDVAPRPDRVGRTIPKEEIVVDGVVKASYYDVAVEMDLRKKRVEERAWDALEEQLGRGEEAPASLIEMVLKPKHYPNVKVNLSAKLDGMKTNELVEHMEGLLKE
jgi:hypothetical protein